MVAASTRPIVIDLGEGERHQAATLSGLHDVLSSLARQCRDAGVVYKASEARHKMLSTRLRLGTVLIQLRPQIGHGGWKSLMKFLSESIGLSKHTMYRAINLAGELATKEGELDPEKVRQAREAMEAVANRKRGAKAKVARAQLLEEYQTDSSEVARAQLLEDEDGISLRQAERYAAVLQDDQEDFELDPIEVDDDAGEKVGAVGAVGGEQLTFSACFEAAGEAVDRAVEACERELLAVADGFGEAAGRLASKFRDAADRIERKVAEVTDG